MPGICFHWEPPATIAQCPKAVKKLMLHWSQVGKAFGVRDFFCLNLTEQPVGMGVDVNFTAITSLDELPAEYSLVYVEQGGAPLVDFEHPEHCIYVFGSDYGQLPRADVEIDSELGLYADQACAIVLHDRKVKHGGNQ